MRFIITGDAHGNDVAFNEVIKNTINKYGNNIDAFIDLGDFTCDFLWGEEIYKTIKKLNEKGKFYGILGNRETGMVIPYYNKKKEGKKIGWNVDSSMGAPLLSCERMSDETLNFISNLPETLLIKFTKDKKENKNDKNTIYIETDLTPLPTPLFLKHKMPLTDEEIKLLKKENCTTILTAHTHILNNNKYDNYDIYNPGSIGLTGDGIPGADYGELFFKNGKWNFISNHIDYNYDEIKRKLFENPVLFEKCQNWGTALLTAVEEGINVPALYMFEKNRIVEELAKGTNKITLDPKDNLTISTMGRYADINHQKNPLKETIIYANNNDLSPKEQEFNQEKPKNIDTSNIKVTNEIFDQALKNIIFYINEAKKNSTTEYEIKTGRLGK